MSLVIFDHYFLKNPTIRGAFPVLPTFLPFTGTTGVIFFFVISGYLITTLMLREEARTGKISLSRFYVRRFLRIFPPFYAYLLATAIVLSAMGDMTLACLRDYIVSGLYLQNFVGGPTSVLKHTWSLSTEEQFYLLWPGLLVLAGRRRGVIMAVGAMLCWPILRVARHGFESLLDQRYAIEVAALDTILWGAVLAILAENQYFRSVLNRMGRSWIIFLFSLALLFIVYSGYKQVPYQIAFLITPIRNLCVTILIWWCISNPGSAVGAWLEKPIMVHFGVLSYSLYLWQQPFYTTMGLTVGPWWLNLLLNLFLLLVMAHLSYFLLEKPLLKWRDRLRT